MRQYAYRVYKNGQLGNPMKGGTVYATTMDDAVKAVIKRSKIKVVEHTNYYTQPEYRFYLNNEKVGILIYANPEDYKEG